MVRLISLCITTVLLTACASSQLPQRDPAFSAVVPADLRPPMNNTGSIYQAGYDMRLFEDNTARRVGDVLTVFLQEKTQAKKAADMQNEKEDDLSMTVPSVFGMGAELLGKDLSTRLKDSKSFKGKGNADQSNSLTGGISVTVVEVLPNGNLKIRGEKRVTLNQGDEFIRLSGIVRPADIDSTNTISSNKVADATFMYTGEGAIADTSSMGWVGRALNSPWFPF